MILQDALVLSKLQSAGDTEYQLLQTSLFANPGVQNFPASFVTEGSFDFRNVKGGIREFLKMATDLQELKLFKARII